MRSPEEIQRLAKDFWVAEAFVNVTALRSYSFIIVTEVQKLCQAWDVDSIDDWLAVYKAGEMCCREEPLATEYEHGLLLITHCIADTHMAMGSFDTMYALIEQIMDLLCVQDERRTKLGLPRHGNSQVRYSALGSLAGAKWLGVAADRDRVMSVEEVYKNFRVIADKVLAYIYNNPDYDDGRMIEALEICGLDVAAMIFRWFHEERETEVSVYVDWYNDHFGNYLSPKPGHCTSHKPLAENWYYWSFELAKLHLCDLMTRPMFEYCNEQRLAVVIDSLSQPRHIDGVFGFWETQNRIILAAMENVNN